MSNVSISSCLKKGLHPPVGSRLPILIPMLIFILAISPFLVSIYLRFHGHNDILAHITILSMTYQQHPVLTHFISTLFTNIITQPLLVGTLLCAIRSQQDDENLKPTFFTAFKTYYYTLKLFPVILFTSIVSTTVFTTGNSLPGLHLFAQHHYYMVYIGLFLSSIVAFLLIYTQIFIVDKQCSTLMALKQTYKKLFKFNIFISFIFSFLLYYLYVFFTLFLIPIGLHFVSLQSHSINYFIVGVVTIGFSLCWLLHALPGLCHIPAYIYLEQTSHSDTSTKENNVNSKITQDDPQERHNTEDNSTAPMDNESPQTT